MTLNRNLSPEGVKSAIAAMQSVIREDRVLGDDRDLDQHLTDLESKGYTEIDQFRTRSGRPEIIDAEPEWFIRADYTFVTDALRCDLEATDIDDAARKFAEGEFKNIKCWDDLAALFDRIGDGAWIEVYDADGDLIAAAGEDRRLP